MFPLVRFSFRPESALNVTAPPNKKISDFRMLNVEWMTFILITVTKKSGLQINVRVNKTKSICVTKEINQDALTTLTFVT